MMNSQNVKFKMIFAAIYFFSSVFIFAADAPVRKPITSSLTKTDPLGVLSTFMSGHVVDAEPVEVNILALRAQFVEDSLKTTTGNGLFDLSNDSDYIIDRPPHNKTYFEHQLLALKNYFHTVSKGKLILNYQVYPPAEDAAYTMPHNMVYYSGEEDEERQKLRWAELLRDAVQAAKADNPTFENFDAFIVFHAGVGNDFAFDFNESPFDIQSAFIDFETLKETLGSNNPDYRGIEAGTNFYIQEAIILPEQQSQKGIDLGLLGTATLLMGSQLGLPSLFNTENGRAGVGMWGLMDQGSYNYFGLIPAQPCAWMKVYMGWEEPVVVHSLDQAILGTANTSSAPHLIKVPINSSEYFLLENRQEDWNGDRMTFGRDEFGKRAQFDSLGNIAIEEGLRVITRVDEYDYGLPGSGILIWHIDENVIRANLESNTINNDLKHRGVDLVECDGPQDIGQQYAMFTPGYGTEAGDYWDPFWSENLSHQYINGNGPVSLTPTSIPNSNGHGRVVTHIEFTNFSDKDTLMTFSISNDWHVPGFPQYTGQTFGEGALNKIILADGSEGIIAVAKNGDIFGWRMDGSKIIDNDETITVTDELGNETTYPLALMASVGDSVLLAPSVYNFDFDDNWEIAIVDQSGIMSIWSPVDGDGDGRADLLARIDLGERITTTPTQQGIAGTENGNFIKFSVLDGSVEINQTIKLANEPLVFHNPHASDAFTTPSGDVYVLDYDGNGLELRWQNSAYGHGDKYYIASIFYNDDNQQKPYVIVSNDGYLTLIDEDGTVLNSETRISQDELVSAPALVDVDNDNYPELIVSTESRVAAFEINTGVPLLNYPIKLDNPGKNQLAAPVFFQSHLNGKPWPHTIIATTTGSIAAFDQNGNMIDGFPLSAGSAVTSTPLLAFGEDYQSVNLFVLSEDGFLYSWNINRDSEFQKSWSRFGNGMNNSFKGDGTAIPPKISADLMPKKRVFCYPNPSEEGRTTIRYTLNDNVENVNIRIYDIAGELVTQLNNGGTFPGDHEVTWDVSNIQSGAYIARVEAQANSGNVVEFIKIAVVK